MFRVTRHGHFEPSILFSKLAFCETFWRFSSGHPDSFVLVDLFRGRETLNYLLQEGKMSEVTRIQLNGPEDDSTRVVSPQSTTDSALGGSTSPDDTSQQRSNHQADSSFSDEREACFESYGENEDYEV